MARRKQTAEVRVYTYDCNGPIENVELVRDQAFRAHRYYNKLVEIERERRNRYEEIREQMCPGFAEVEAKVEDLDQQIDALRAEINADKARERTRRVDQEKAARLKELREQRKALFAELKQKRDEFNAAIGSAAEEFRRRYKARIGESKDVGLMFEARSETLEEMLAEPEWSDAWKAVARSDAEGVAKAKLARAESGLLKGTYDLVDAAFQSAKAKAKLSPPRFHRWDGNGRVGRRLTPPVPVASLFDASSAPIKIRPLPADTWDTRPGRRKAKTELTVFLGRGVLPVTIPFIMHRPLPEGGTVRGFWIRVRRVGVRTFYSVQLTVEGGTAWRAPTKSRSTHRAEAVAVNFGWRLLHHGVRVAYWLGTDGRSGEVVIPSIAPPPNHRDRKRGEQPYSLLDRLDYPDTLRAIQDRVFNAARAVVVEKRAELGLKWPDERDGKDRLQYAHAWRSPAKLAAFANHLVAQYGKEALTQLYWHTWRKERIAAGLDLIASFETIDAWAQERGLSDPCARFAFYLECWRRKDAHLYQWASNQRDRALLHRREIYRIAARQLEREYGQLAIDDTDFKKLAERPKPEEQDDSNDKVRRRRKQAAPGELRGAMKLAFGDSRIITVESSGNSKYHHNCGAALHGSDQDLVVRCESCSLTIDRDENNCMNLLRKSGFEPERLAAE